MAMRDVAAPRPRGCPRRRPCNSRAAASSTAAAMAQITRNARWTNKLDGHTPRCRPHARARGFPRRAAARRGRRERTTATVGGVVRRRAIQSRHLRRAAALRAKGSRLVRAQSAQTFNRTVIRPRSARKAYSRRTKQRKCRRSRPGNTGRAASSTAWNGLNAAAHCRAEAPHATTSPKTPVETMVQTPSQKKEHDRRQGQREKGFFAGQRDG